MQIVTPALLEQYLQDDWVLERLNDPAARADDAFTIQRWLRDSPPKRMIFSALYGDLFKDSPKRSVLDVGGGFSHLTRHMAARHDYELLEISAHDAAEKIREAEGEVKRKFFIEADWAAHTPKKYDIIVANDLFPNVDQRLSMFVKQYLPHARELRLSLTFYNTPRAYATKRIDGDETLTMLAYDGAHTALALATYEKTIGAAALAALKSAHVSVYPNGRQVALLTLKGDHSP